MKTSTSLIDFDVIFLIQSSEFIRSLNFGSNLKKKTKIVHFTPTNWFLYIKNIFLGEKWKYQVSYAFFFFQITSKVQRFYKVWWLYRKYLVQFSQSRPYFKLKKYFFIHKIQFYVKKWKKTFFFSNYFQSSEIL